MATVRSRYGVSYVSSNSTQEDPHYHNPKQDLQHDPHYEIQYEPQHAPQKDPQNVPQHEPKKDPQNDPQPQARHDAQHESQRQAQNEGEGYDYVCRIHSSDKPEETQRDVEFEEQISEPGSQLWKIG